MQKFLNPGESRRAGGFVPEKSREYCNIHVFMEGGKVSMISKKLRRDKRSDQCGNFTLRISPDVSWFDSANFEGDVSLDGHPGKGRGRACDETRQ